MDYTISKHTEDFESQIDQIARLKTINWGLDFEVFRSYVKWNYIDRPHSKPPIIYFVRAGEEIVAMRGVYETTWQLKSASASYNALCAADLLILKEYRKKGIYKELANFVKRDLDTMGVQYEFSFNATPLNTMISLSMGWKSMGEIKNIKKQFQTSESRVMTLARRLAGPYARKLLRKTGIGMILNRSKRDNSQRIDMIYHNPGTQLPPHIVLDNKPRPEEMALLVNSTLPENKITLVRDEMYFLWRYNNPLSKYLFLYWYDGGLKGYLVLQSHLYSMEPGGVHNILELEAAVPSIRIELLNALMSLMDSGSISIWATMLDRESRDFLISKGFEEEAINSVNEPRRTMLLRPLGGQSDTMEFQGLNLLDANSWDFKMIYMHDH